MNSVPPVELEVVDVFRRDALRRLYALAAVAAFGTPRRAGALAPRRLGIFHWGDHLWLEREYPGLFRALAQKGWREGSTLALDWRQVRMDDPDLDAAAARLAAAAPHAIFSESTRATRALQGATRTIPIVTSVGDPVSSGFAASLARPGGNITGLALLVGAEAKIIDLMREIFPDVRRIAFFFPAPVATSQESARQYMAAAARSGLETRLMLIDAKDAEAAMREALRWGARVGFAGPFLDEQPTRRVAEAARTAGLPLLSFIEQFRDSFAITLVVHHVNNVKSLVAVLDKVLRGAHPGEIPFETPDSVKIIVNRRVLAALGVNVPPAVLLRATQVIE